MSSWSPLPNGDSNSHTAHVSGSSAVRSPDVVAVTVVAVVNVVVVDSVVAVLGVTVGVVRLQ